VVESHNQEPVVICGCIISC